MAKDVSVVVRDGLVIKSGTCTVTGKLFTVAVSKTRYDAWKNGQFIQVAMPDLSDDGREFLKSGITPAEWDQMFSPEDEGDDE